MNHSTRSQREPLVGEIVDDVPDDLHPELEVLARWMDSIFEIPGLRTRFGLDVILGLLPGLGDTATSLVSLYILTAASRFGVPRITLVRMALNIALDWIVGIIPLAGDVFDIYWKANVRNVELLRRHLVATPAEERRYRRSDWWFVGGLVIALIATLLVCITVTWLLVATLGRTLYGLWS